MPILNYTTKVAPRVTAAQLQATLGNKGAKRVSVDYNDSGEPIAIEFMIEVAKSPVWFRLPCNIEGVHDALYKQKIERKYKTREHAKSVAWRIVKDWVEAQLAIVEANQAEMAEVFMPYVIDKDGVTMYARFKESHVKQLNAAPDNVVEGKFQTGTE